MVRVTFENNVQRCGKGWKVVRHRQSGCLGHERWMLVLEMEAHRTRAMDEIR